MFTTVIEKLDLLSPGQKQPTNKEDRLFLRQFLLKMVPEELSTMEDCALRRAYILAHSFLEGEELTKAQEKLLPEMKNRGLPLDLGRFATDRGPLIQNLESLSDAELLSLHRSFHGEEKQTEENSYSSPLCELVCLLDAMANLLRRYI